MNSNKASSRTQRFARGLSLMSALSTRKHRSISAAEASALPGLTAEEIAAMEMSGADMGPLEAYDTTTGSASAPRTTTYAPHVAYRPRFNICLRLSRGIRRDFVPYIGAMCRKCCTDAARIARKERRNPSRRSYSGPLLDGG